MRRLGIAAFGVVVGLWSLSIGPVLSGQDLVQIREGDGKPGEQETYTVALHAAPQEVRAFGVELVYDLKVLRYTGAFSRGPLVEALEFFNASEPAPGEIRLGGFTVAHRIAAGTSGDLAALQFERLVEGDASLRVTGLVDDLAPVGDVKVPAGGAEEAQ